MKIFWNEKRIDSGRYDRPLRRNRKGKFAKVTVCGRIVKGVRWTGRMLKYALYGTLGVSVIASALLISAHIGGEINPKIVHADPIVETVVVESTSTPPIMEKIAQCESGKHQFAKNGLVLTRKNSDGSSDYGYYQINSVHLVDAARLGYNIMLEKDNIAYAMYLYHTKGTQPWYSSDKCVYQ